MDIKKLLKKLTLEEKASLCSGLDNWHTKPIERLGIPSIMMADGPHGLRKEIDNGESNIISDSYPATCFPTASALASTWNRELLFQIGAALGEECQTMDVQVILGPGVNIKRSPLCGRNFEYFSEDPYLSGEMAVALINGVQSMGVGTSLKHYAVNNQEYRRMLIDAIVDEGALREIYLAGFERAVKQAQPWTVMAAYNKLNGEYCSQHRTLLSDILREEWQFDGIVVSDWGAVDNRVKGVAAGLDLEMPGIPNGNDERVIEAVKSGSLTEKELDTVVERMLALILKADSLKKEGFGCDMDAHHALAKTAAAEGAVLLKNENGLLPVDKTEKIAVIGAFAMHPRYQGSGSSLIHPYRMDTLLGEMQKICGQAKITYARGYDLSGKEDQDTLINEAVDAAKGADAVVVCVGLTDLDEIEGMDRVNMHLPESHNQLVEAIAAVNPRTVVLLSNGSPVEMPWIDQVPAVLEGYLAGQAGASAHAAILLGEINPSGKLAESFPLKLEDTPAYSCFPAGPKTVEHRESLFVGYRYYDTAKKEVLYPFGHGLSYTNFEYSDLKVNRKIIKKGDAVKLTFRIKNAGSVRGKETAQIYVRDVKSTLVRPQKELKGFSKVDLAPGTDKQVTVKLDERAFAFYDPSAEEWVVEPGEFEILVGTSSRDIRLETIVEVRGNTPILSTDGNKALEDFLKKKQVSDPDFEKLTGHPLPDNSHNQRPFTLQTPIIDMQETLVGGILKKRIKRQVAEMVNADMHQSTRLMIEKMALESPLRLLIMFSGGALNEDFLKALLNLANGKIWEGIKGLLANR